MIVDVESLLPCPFCGAEVTMRRGDKRLAPIWYQVECDCGAIAGCGHTLEGKAAADWNRRSSAAPTILEAVGELERLQACERKLKAMSVWLEAEQPDVFRRGIWDAPLGSEAKLKKESFTCGNYTIEKFDDKSIWIGHVSGESSGEGGHFHVDKIYADHF